MLASCTGVDARAVNGELIRRLDRLDGLTPGDFANVARRFALLSIDAGVDDWLAELDQEWQARPTAGSRIGF